MRKKIKRELWKVVRNAIEKDHKAEAMYWIKEGWIPGDRLHALRKVKTEPYKEKTPEKPYMLYAVDIGTCIKVGITSNLTQRLKAIQTHSPQTVAIIWSALCGYTLSNARQMEKKLFRHIGRYRLKGEHFDYDAKDKILAFRVKNLRGPDKKAAQMHDELDSAFVLAMDLDGR